MSKYKVGIIGGSGLYHIEGFTKQKWVKVKTPFGNPSDDFLTGELAGRAVACRVTGARTGRAPAATTWQECHEEPQRSHR
jgi:5'-methylthioadenosine phosphorylase